MKLKNRQDKVYVNLLLFPHLLRLASWQTSQKVRVRGTPTLMSLLRDFIGEQKRWRGIGFGLCSLSGEHG
jgi:hypothetical protein